MIWASTWHEFSPFFLPCQFRTDIAWARVWVGSWRKLRYLRRAIPSTKEYTKERNQWRLPPFSGISARRRIFPAFVCTSLLFLTWSCGVPKIVWHTPSVVVDYLQSEQSRIEQSHVKFSWQLHAFFLSIACNSWSWRPLQQKHYLIRKSSMLEYVDNPPAIFHCGPKSFL